MFAPRAVGLLREVSIDEYGHMAPMVHILFECSGHLTVVVQSQTLWPQTSSVTSSRFPLPHHVPCRRHTDTARCHIYQQAAITTDDRIPF
jgi:hypothetical protein